MGKQRQPLVTGRDWFDMSDEAKRQDIDKLLLDKI